MKAAPSYVLIFVLIPLEWMEHPLSALHFSFGRNGSLPTNDKRNDSSQRGKPPLLKCDPQSLASHLFWTWFVDNPLGANPS